MAEDPDVGWIYGVGFRVEAIDPGHSIVAMIHSQEIDLPGDIAICMMLRPLDPDGRRTRMTLRLRGRFWGAPGRLFGLVFDFGDFLFMRKMLMGIKERAEAAYRP